MAPLTTRAVPINRSLTISVLASLTSHQCGRGGGRGPTSARREARGTQVPRRRQSSYATPLLAGALAASLMLAPSPAGAQVATPAGNAAADDGGSSSLLSP